MLRRSSLMEKRPYELLRMSMVKWGCVFLGWSKEGAGGSGVAKGSATSRGVGGQIFVPLVIICLHAHNAPPLDVSRRWSGVWCVGRRHEGSHLCPLVVRVYSALR